VLCADIGAQVKVRPVLGMQGSVNSRPLLALLCSLLTCSLHIMVQATEVQSIKNAATEPSEVLSVPVDATPNAETSGRTLRLESYSDSSRLRLIDPFIEGLPLRTEADIMRDAWKSHELRWRRKHEMEHAAMMRAEGLEPDSVPMPEMPPVPPLPPVPYDGSWDPRTDPRFNTTCPSLFEIRDQGDCAADWAAAVASAMTDRICMQTAGKDHATISIEDFLSCCKWV
jgi:hypothetical protein